MPEYRAAEEVAMIAKDLIEKSHPHLKEVNIAYLFRDPPAKSKGEEVMGKASKVTGKYKELTGKDFVIEISESHFFNLDDNGQVALVDHELSHCWVNDEGKPVLVPHDFEGFRGTLRRYGLWRSDLQMLKGDIDQLKLPFKEEGADSVDVETGYTQEELEPVNY